MILLTLVVILALGCMQLSAFAPMCMTSSHSPRASSRRVFLTKGASTFVAAATGLSCGPPPSFADSTGKYSTKATARKRYIPRIQEGAKAWASVGSDVGKGSLASARAFAKDVLPELSTAMDLYGSSLKKGEYPDSRSRGLQKMSADFGLGVKALDNAAASGKADQAQVAFMAADELLRGYIKSAELSDDVPL